MTRPRAADDFTTIRARMEELRRERAPAPKKESRDPDTAASGGRSLLKATPLHLATIRNRHDAIRLLIARGADLNKRDFPDNAAPLHFAAAHGVPVERAA